MLNIKNEFYPPPPSIWYFDGKVIIRLFNSLHVAQAVERPLGQRNDIVKGIATSPSAPYYHFYNSFNDLENAAGNFQLSCSNWWEYFVNRKCLCIIWSSSSSDLRSIQTSACNANKLHWYQEHVCLFIWYVFEFVCLLYFLCCYL